LFGAKSDKNINSSRKSCERLLETKESDQKIKQLHKAENQENKHKCTPWVNLPYLSGKGYNDLGSKVFFCIFLVIFSE